MQKLVAEYDFNNEEDIDKQDDFPFWIDFGRAGGIDLTAEDLNDRPIERLMTAIENWDLKTEKSEFEISIFRNLFFDYPKEILEALCRLVKNKKWTPTAWIICLEGLNLEIIIKSEMTEQINGALESATDDQLKELNSSASRYIKLIALTYDVDQEITFSKIWLKLWNSIDRKQSFKPMESDVMTKALHSSAGWMTEAALRRMHKYPKGNNAELPSSIKFYFNEIVNARDGHLGKVILAINLFFLFENDPKWTKEILISRFSPAEDTESQELWLAYSLSNRIGPNLIGAIRDPFVDIMLNSKAVSDSNIRLQLTKLFMLICLYAPPSSLKQKKLITNAMSEDMLEGVLSYFSDVLISNEDENAEIWQKVIQPWLDNYWPKSGKNRTTKMAEIMAEIMAKCGSAKNEATEWFLNNLVPKKEYALDTLKSIALTDKSAETTLKIVTTIAENNVIHQKNKKNLKMTLDNIKTADKKLSNDARLKPLYKIAQS